MNKLQKKADLLGHGYSDAAVGGFVGLGLGVPAALVDYFKSGNDPEMKNAKLKRVAKAIATGVLWGGGGFLAGAGVNAASRLADK